MQHVLLGCRKAGECSGRHCVHCEGDWVLRVVANGAGARARARARAPPARAVRVHEVKHALSVRNAGVVFANKGLTTVTKQSRHHAGGVGVLGTPSARERSERLRIERRLAPGTETGPASGIHDRTPAASFLLSRAFALFLGLYLTFRGDDGDLYFFLYFLSETTIKMNTAQPDFT
jgi:hypothetical protein